MRPFEEDFKLLNNTLQEMGALVAHSVHKSVFSLIDKNEDYAHQVLRDEARVDQMEIQIDDLATSLIVREQPVARDMRFVVVAIKINTDLERMGDLAVNVVERALSLMQQPALPEAIDFREIANLVESMVLSSLEAFVKRDDQIARRVLATDDAVDKSRNAIHQQVMGLMQRDPSTVPRAVDHLIIARSLERIGDHATNIAEDVIFMVQGIDVRHQATVEAA
ncbi:MAG TPA: phosphate signaling complex protein PhoU [Bryobacteraceae bacterium]|jgi:phosphate transport system protein|nr:phosphate signaling complex protein PhoU [Bryobacteraceae bacterium]